MLLGKTLPKNFGGNVVGYICISCESYLPISFYWLREVNAGFVCKISVLTDNLLGQITMNVLKTR